LIIEIAGSAARLPKTQRRQEEQNQIFVALSCETQFHTSDSKGLLVLAGEAGSNRGFLCAFASWRENITLTAEPIISDSRMAGQAWP